MMISLPLIVNVIFVKSADYSLLGADDEFETMTSTMTSDQKIQWIKVFCSQLFCENACLNCKLFAHAFNFCMFAHSF